MTKRQLDLKLGPILGQITAGTDSCPYGKESGGILTTPGVMCHAQVVGGSEVSKYKIGRFFWSTKCWSLKSQDTFDEIFRAQVQNWRKEAPSMIGTPKASKDIIYHFGRRIQNVLIESNRSGVYCGAINSKSHIVNVHTKDSELPGFGSELPSDPERWLFVTMLVALHITPLTHWVDAVLNKLFILIIVLCLSILSIQAKQPIFKLLF